MFQNFLNHCFLKKLKGYYLSINSIIQEIKSSRDLNSSMERTESKYGVV